MEIKSSLLNGKDFKFVKESLIKASEKDGKERVRIKALEYIDTTSSNNDDMFFYDMLEFVRFEDPSSSHTAYTTPDKLIYLNCPCERVGESAKKWDFIYDHECMHQLWDTFKVGNKIEEKFGECNHKLLNWASDCVINDYLNYYRKKPYPTDDLITPEYLKSEFGITYDRKNDTQYSLYVKLMEKIDEIKKDPNYQNADDNSNGEPQGGSGEGESQNQSQSQGQNQGSKGEGKGENKSKGGQEGNNKGSKDNKGQEKGSTSSKDKENQGEGEGNKEEKKNGEGKEGKEGNPNGNGEGTSQKGDNIETDTDLAELRKKASEIIEDYKKKISGDLGNFLKKCKGSLEMKKDGLMVKANKGFAEWNQKMNAHINAYVKNRIFKKKREYKKTYQRVKRGSGFVEQGQPIKQGRKIKDDKMNINAAFYIDRSGSMSGNMDNVFDACYIICEALKKNFSREKVVGNIYFKIHAFDDNIEELKYGKRVQARGGNVPFHEILEYIEKNTNDFLINIIITDGQYTMSEPEIKKFLKNIKGMVIYIANNDDADILKKLSKDREFSTTLYYIVANDSFKIKND